MIVAAIIVFIVLGIPAALAWGVLSSARVLAHAEDQEIEP